MTQWSVFLVRSPQCPHSEPSTKGAESHEMSVSFHTVTGPQRPLGEVSALGGDTGRPPSDLAVLATEHRSAFECSHSCAGGCDLPAQEGTPELLPPPCQVAGKPSGSRTICYHSDFFYFSLPLVT